MAFTEQTRTQLIGLSVAMLGQAPGAKRLQEWINAYNDGMTLEDLAEHIADSEGFKSQYGLSTSEEFAADFLGAVMDGNASGAALGAAEAVVVGALNDGSSQADIALLLVTVLMGLAGDGDNDLYANYGKAAEAFHNKVEVAEHYTLKAKMADPSASVLEGVTDDPATVEAAKRDIDSPPADAVFAEPGAFAIDENASGAETPVAVGMVAATDANGDEVAYRLVNAPDGFAIDAATGAVTYTGGGLDYETTPAVELTVHASSTGANGQPTEVPLKVTVNVGDVQESDAVFADAKLAIDENVAEGMVGKVTATDAEGDAVAYRLAEGSPAGFSIDGATGEVSYKGDDLDHEAAATVDLTVIATSIGANNMATDVSKTFTVSIGDVDDLPDEPMRFVLTPTIDDFQGGDADDTFVAAPVQGADRNFAETLNAFDSIDGGGGADTILVSGEADLDISLAQVSNIEKANIRAPGSISADMSEWAGLESVKIDRFGSADFVTVIVNGASVEINDRLTIGGAATIVGAKGAVDIKAGSGSAVHVGSAGHTETVMVKGGASVKVDSGATGDKQQSKTIKKVVVDGVERGAVEGAEDAENPVPNTDNVKTATIPANNATLSPGLNVAQYVREATAAEIIANGGPIDDSGARTPTGTTNVLAITASEAALNTYYIADLDKKSDGVELGTPPAEGVILVTTNVKEAAGYTETGGKEAVAGTVEATVNVYSDAIETIQLHNTKAIAVVTDNSKKKDDDGKDVPDRAPLAVAVEDFDGELRLQGTTVSDDITFTVVKASDFDLVASTKMVTIEGDAKLTLDIKGSAETIKVSGKGGVTMANLSGMNSLKMIDASGSSGANHFRSQAGTAPDASKDELKALTMVKGGSGKDTVTLLTSAKGKLEHVDTGDGGDMVTITGAHRTKGLEVDLGAGDDTFVGNNGGDKDSRIDGGAGRDTLKLSATPATYKEDGKDVSIFSNFNVLDVGGAVANSTFDLELLGIDTGDVLATGGTAGAVTLKNMAVGMGITVKAEKKGAPATADITHEFVDGLRRDQDLNVNLEAIGNDKDTEAGTTGEVTLKLDVHSRVDTVKVNSSASVGGSKTEAADDKPGAANYNNTLDLDGADDVRDIEVTGDASLTIKGGALGEVRLIDASESGGGVTFTATGSGAIELSGGAGDDTLNAATSTTYEINGGEGDDTLTAGTGGGKMTGGAGADMLIGGAGNDRFIIEYASDSRIKGFNESDDAQGMDTIGRIGAALYTPGTGTGDNRTGDSIVLPKSLVNSFQGRIKQAGDDNVNVTDASWIIDGGNMGDPDPSPNTVKAFVDANKDGFFETRTETEGGFGGTTNKHSVAVVHQADDGIVSHTWLFIDIDGDGDLNITKDHVIRFVGDIALTTADFVASS